MVLLYSAANYLEANMLKGMLAFHGIEVFLKGEGLSSAVGELPATVIQIDLYVDEKDKEKAEQLVNDYFAARSEDADDWLCSHCGEQNGATFQFCWHCEADAPKVCEKCES